MNPYTLSCVHAANLDLYRLALSAATEPADIAMLGKLIGMEGDFLAVATDVLDDLAALRSAQHALVARPAAHAVLRSL